MKMRPMVKHEFRDCGCERIEGMIWMNITIKCQRHFEGTNNYMHKREFEFRNVAEAARELKMIANAPFN